MTLVRPRKKDPSVDQAAEVETRPGIDVNAVVSYNLKGYPGAKRLDAAGSR